MSSRLEGCLRLIYLPLVLAGETFVLYDAMLQICPAVELGILLSRKISSYDVSNVFGFIIWDYLVMLARHG